MIIHYVTCMMPGPSVCHAESQESVSVKVHKPPSYNFVTNAGQTSKKDKSREWARPKNRVK